MRASVEEFAIAMEVVLVKNDHKTGWSHLTTSRLITMLKNEVRELEGAFDKCDPTEVKHEVTDIANFCMMIHENLTQRDKRRGE